MRNKGRKIEWNEWAQEATENNKRELNEAPVLGMPAEKGIYVFDSDASVVAFQEYCIRNKNEVEEQFYMQARFRLWDFLRARAL